MLLKRRLTAARETWLEMHHASTYEWHSKFKSKQNVRFVGPELKTDLNLCFEHHDVELRHSNQMEECSPEAPLLWSLYSWAYS